MDSYEHNPANHTGQPSAWDIPYDPERDRFVISKALKSMSGVYLIQNVITGRRYVGSSATIGKRIERHLHHTRSESIKQDIETHGRQSFHASILELVGDLDSLRAREQFWIAEMRPEYNKCYFVGAVGYRQPDEVRAKVSAANSRRRHSPEAKAKTSQAMLGRANQSKGKKRSDETRARMRQGHAGRVVTDDMRAALRRGWAERRERREAEASWMLAIMIHCGAVAGRTKSRWKI